MDDSFAMGSPRPKPGVQAAPARPGPIGVGASPNPSAPHPQFPHLATWAGDHVAKNGLDPSAFQMHNGALAPVGVQYQSAPAPAAVPAIASPRPASAPRQSYAAAQAAMIHQHSGAYRNAAAANPSMSDFASPERFPCSSALPVAPVRQSASGSRPGLMGWQG